MSHSSSNTIKNGQNILGVVNMSTKHIYVTILIYGASEAALYSILRPMLENDEIQGNKSPSRKAVSFQILPLLTQRELHYIETIYTEIYM
jgi:hypothetical protein